MDFSQEHIYLIAAIATIAAVVIAFIAWLFPVSPGTSVKKRIVVAITCFILFSVVTALVISSIPQISPNATKTPLPQMGGPTIPLTSTLSTIPSPIPVTPTPTLEIGQDFKINCISRSLWIPFHGEAHSVDSRNRNCWDLTDWKFVSQDSGLRTSVSTENFTAEKAIYASFSSEGATIDFELNIETLKGGSKAYPAVMEFGITPEMVAASYYGQSLPGQNLFISGGSSNTDYFYSIGQTYADPKKDSIQFPADSLDHHITLALDVSTLTFSFDGTQIAKTDFVAPPGNRYFRIGYEEPAYSTVTTFIHDLTVKYQP